MIKMGKKKDTNTGFRGLLAPFRTGPSTTANTSTPLTSFASRPGGLDHTPSPTLPTPRPSAPMPYIHTPSPEMVHVPAGSTSQGLLAPVNIGSPLALGEFGQMSPVVRGRANSLEMDNLSTGAGALPIALAGVIEGQRLTPSPRHVREMAPAPETPPVAVTDPRLGHLVGVPLIIAEPKPMGPGFSDSQPVTTTGTLPLPFGMSMKRDRSISRSQSGSPSNAGPIPTAGQQGVEMAKTTSLSRFGTMLGLNNKKSKKDTRGSGSGSGVGTGSSSISNIQTMVTPGTSRQRRYQELASPPPLPPQSQGLPQQRPYVQPRNMSLPSNRATRARFVGDVYTVRSPSKKAGPSGSVSVRPMGDLQMNTLDGSTPKPQRKAPIVDSHLDDEPTCSEWPVLKPTPAPASPSVAGSPGPSSKPTREVKREYHDREEEGRSLAHSLDVQHHPPHGLDLATPPRSEVPSHPTGSGSRSRPVSRSRSSSSPWEYISSVSSPTPSPDTQKRIPIPSNKPPAYPTVLPSTPISRLDRARATLRRVFTPPSPATHPISTGTNSPPPVPNLPRFTPPTIPARTTSIQQRTPFSDTTTPRQLPSATPIDFPLPPIRTSATASGLTRPASMSKSRSRSRSKSKAAQYVWPCPASNEALSKFCPSPYDPAKHGVPSGSTSAHVSPEAALPDDSPLDRHGVLPSWIPSPEDQPAASTSTSASASVEQITDEMTDPDTSIEQDDGPNPDPALSHKRSMRAMQAAHDRMRMMTSRDIPLRSKSTSASTCDSRSTRTISGTGTESSFGHEPGMQYMSYGKPSSPKSGLESDTESRISPRQALRVEMIERQLSVLSGPLVLGPAVPEPKTAPGDIEEIKDLVDDENEPQGMSSSSTFGQLDRLSLKSRLASIEPPQTPDGRQHQRTPSSRLRQMVITNDDDDNSPKCTERKPGPESESESGSESESSRVYAILSSAKRDRDTDKAIEALHETARQAIQSPIRRSRLASSVSGTNRSRPSTPGSSRATPYTISRTGAGAGAVVGIGARPRKLTFSSNTTTTTDLATTTTMMTPSDESRVSKRIVSPWRDRVGYALNKREEKEGPLKHGPKPSMAGSADWTRRSSKGTCTEGSVVNDDQDQPPVPQVPRLPEYRDPASLGVSTSASTATATSVGVSPKSKTRSMINHPSTFPSEKSERPSLSVSTSQLHLSTSNSSIISPLPRSMRKVSPGIMSRASALLDRSTGESSSSGQSALSRRGASPAEMTTAPTSLEPSDDDEGCPSPSPSPSPSPCPAPAPESDESTTVANPILKTVTATATPNTTADEDEDQLAKERELADLRCELERNAFILRTLVDKLREQDEEDEALRNEVDIAVENNTSTPRSRVASASARGTPTPRGGDGCSRVKVAIDVELQLTPLQSQSRSPRVSASTSTPTASSRTVAKPPSSLRNRTPLASARRDDQGSDNPISTPLRSRVARQWTSDPVPAGSPR